MNSIFSVVLLSVLIPEMVQGACRIIPQETMAIPGKKVSLDCLYKSSIRVPYQQEHRDYESCEDCRCTENGLECCGFGNNAGVFHIEGCIEKKEGCYSTFVDAKDPTKPCEATTESTTQTPAKNEQVPDDKGFRNPYASGSQESLYNVINSPNSLYNWDEPPSDNKAERQRQFEFLMSLLQYYMANN